MLAIFDMSSVNIVRYNLDYLNNHSGQYIAYVDDPNLCTELANPAATLFCSSGWSIKRFIRSFESHCVTVVMISGQRPADFRVVIAANKLNIPIIYKMHGLYVENIKRNFSFYLINIDKVFRTVGYLLDIGVSTKSTRIVIGIFLSFVLGKHHRSWMAADILRVDHALIWSEYWKSWHQCYWAMNPRQGWEVIGNPDTTKFTYIQSDDQSLCYVYQTLVEDGVVSRSIMESFYDELERIGRSKNITINVKWHIRGDASICDGLEERGFHIQNNLPAGGIYVGHYSSLLGMVPLIGGFLIIFELEGSVTPEPIKQCATLVTNDIHTLAEGVKLTYVLDESKTKMALYYFGGFYLNTIDSSIISQYINKV